MPALAAVEEWITRMLRMLGLGEGSPTDSFGTRSIGWGTAPIEGEEGTADVCNPLILLLIPTDSSSRKKRY